MIPRTVRWLLVVAFVVTALGVINTAAPAQAVPAQQLVCGWQNIGSSSKASFHIASAFDTDKNEMYTYGGMNDSEQAENELHKLTFGTPLAAVHTNVAAGGALDRAGAAGAYRAKGADSDDSAAYFFGGLGDIAGGNADGDVQRYMTKSGTWERITPSGQFAARFFAAAAYDPDHDVIWVTGGVSDCKLSEVKTGQTCSARALETAYLSFDATTGAPMWNTLPGGSMRLYGHSMVYDPTGKRMVLFGGTNDIQKGSNAAQALDLSDPDPAKAAFGALQTSGTAPSVYFHGAAVDLDKGWMIVYGGAKANFLQSNESTESKTYALDLAAAPRPTWSDLSTTMGDRVGGAMEYNPAAMAVIFTDGRQKATNPDQLKAVKTIQALTCAVPPTPAPTNTKAPTNTPAPGQPTVAPKPTVDITPAVCDFIVNRVPGAVINAATANPASVQGYNELQNPGVPESPWNVRRTKLSLRNISAPWHALYNGLIYKAGCP